MGALVRAGVLLLFSSGLFASDFNQQVMFMRRAQASCENSADCPASIGAMVRVDDAATNNLFQCTAALIGPDMVLTSRHCLSYATHTGWNCRGSVVFAFPASDRFKSERIGCESVVYASEPAGKTLHELLREPDVAILRLEKKTDRPPLELNSNGLQDGLPVRVISAAPVSAVNSKIQLQRCQVKQQHPILSNFTRDDAPVGVITGCSFQTGNSGSPVIDDEGRVRAVLHGTVKTAPGQAAPAFVTNISEMKAKY